MRRYLPLLALLTACDAASSTGNTYTPDVVAGIDTASDVTSAGDTGTSTEVSVDCAEQCAATGACEFVDGACRPTKPEHCRDNEVCQAKKHLSYATCCFAEGPRLCVPCGGPGVSPHPYQ